MFGFVTFGFCVLYLLLVGYLVFYFLILVVELFAVCIVNFTCMLLYGCICVKFMGLCLQLR